MSLPIKDTVSNTSISSPATTMTWAHTVTNAQSNLALIVAVTPGLGKTCTGVTYNGTTMTLLMSVVQSSITTYIFTLVPPSTGTHNIVATFSASTVGDGLAVSYYNVAQSSTFGTAATASGISGNSSNTVTTTSTNQIVLDILWQNGTTSTATAGQTVETSDFGFAAAYFADIAATGSNMTLTWTNLGSPNTWMQISVAMNVACTPNDSATPSSLTYTDSGSQTVQLINSGTCDAQAWTASKTQGWLSLSPTSGTQNHGQSTTITAAVSLSGVTANKSTDTITIAVTGLPNITIPVSLFQTNEQLGIVRAGTNEGNFTQPGGSAYKMYSMIGTKGQNQQQRRRAWNLTKPWLAVARLIRNV